MVNFQESKCQTKHGTRNTCKTFQKYSNGWSRNSPCESLLALCSKLLYDMWSCVWYSFCSFLTAWKEKSRINSYGLGQVPCLCCCGSGQLSNDASQSSVLVCIYTDLMHYYFAFLHRLLCLVLLKCLKLISGSFLPFCQLWLVTVLRYISRMFSSIFD